MRWNSIASRRTEPVRRFLMRSKRERGERGEREIERGERERERRERERGGGEGALRTVLEN